MEAHGRWARNQEHDKQLYQAVERDQSLPAKVAKPSIEMPYVTPPRLGFFCAVLV